MDEIALDIRELFDVLKEHGKVVVYEDAKAKRFKDFLSYIELDCTYEDVGGSPAAPEMWRFTKM